MLSFQEQITPIHFPIKHQENALGMMNNCILKSIFSSDFSLDISFTPVKLSNRIIYIVAETTVSTERSNEFINSFFASDRRLRTFIHNALVKEEVWGDVVMAGNYLGHFPEVYGVVVLPAE